MGRARVWNAGSPLRPLSHPSSLHLTESNDIGRYFDIASPSLLCGGGEQMCGEAATGVFCGEMLLTLRQTGGRKGVNDMFAKISGFPSGIHAISLPWVKFWVTPFPLMRTSYVHRS